MRLTLSAEHLQTLLAYNAADKTDERLIELSKLSLKLINVKHALIVVLNYIKPLQEQLSMYNARQYIRMRHGGLAADFFDAIFKNFGLKYLDMKKGQ